MLKRLWGEPRWTDVDSFCAIVAVGMLLVVALLLSGCSSPCDQHWKCYGAACGPQCR